MGELIEDTGAGSTPPFHKEFSSALHPYSVTGLLRTEVLLVERACSKQNAIGTGR